MPEKIFPSSSIVIDFEFSLIEFSDIAKFLSNVYVLPSISISRELSSIFSIGLINPGINKLATSFYNGAGYTHKYYRTSEVTGWYNTLSRFTVLTE